jgi:hypothetical protein
MHAVMWIIPTAALTLAAASLACFAVAVLRRNAVSQSSRSSPGHRNVSGEAEHNTQPANLPAPGGVALISLVLAYCETAHSQS